MSPEQVLEVYRYVTSFVCWLILFSGFGWLKAYYGSLVINQKVLAENFLGAPLKAFFILHAAFFVLAFVIAAGNLYAVYIDAPFNPLSLITLPASIAILWGVRATTPFLRHVAEQTEVK